MSHVLSVVVFADIMFNENAFEEAVTTAYGERVLRCINDYEYGGTKGLQAHVLVGGINYADMDRLGAALRAAYDAAPEDDRGYIQVAWENEHDQGFTFVTLTKGDGLYVQNKDDQSRLLSGWRLGMEAEGP